MTGTVTGTMNRKATVNMSVTLYSSSIGVSYKKLLALMTTYETSVRSEAE